MPHKEISLQELLKMAQSGAKIQTEERQQIVAHIHEAVPDTGPTTIEQFSELIEKLEQLISISQSRIDADRARYEAQVELLAVLQSTIKAQGVTKLQPQSAPIVNVDLGALKSVLSDIQRNTQPVARSGYEFDIKRTHQGFIDKIIAAPSGSRKLG